MLFAFNRGIAVVALDDRCAVPLVMHENRMVRGVSDDTYTGSWLLCGCGAAYQVGNHPV